MALLTCALTLDLYDGQGNPVTQGAAYLTPSAQLTAPPDSRLVLEAPVSASFEGSGLPQVTLLATDNADVMPQGWAWDLSFAWVPGNPASWSFPLPAGTVSFTATHASPAVFTFAPSQYLTSLPDGTGMQLSGGSLPGGFSSGTTYYVTGASGYTFQLAATAGGSPLASTSTGSGTVTAVSYNLSALSPVSDAVTFQAYLPMPSGTSAAGLIPVAAGPGGASAWGLPPFNIDGGSAYGGQFPASVINGGNA